MLKGEINRGLTRFTALCALCGNERAIEAESYTEAVTALERAGWIRAPDGLWQCMRHYGPASIAVNLTKTELQIIRLAALPHPHLLEKIERAMELLK